MVPAFLFLPEKGPVLVAAGHEQLPGRGDIRLLQPFRQPGAVPAQVPQAAVVDGAIQDQELGLGLPGASGSISPSCRGRLSCRGWMEKEPLVSMTALPMPLMSK